MNNNIIDLADAMRLHPSALAGVRPLVGPQVIDDPRPSPLLAPRKSARPKGTTPISQSSLGGPVPSDPRTVVYPSLGSPRCRPVGVCIIYAVPPLTHAHQPCSLGGLAGAKGPSGWCQGVSTATQRGATDESS